MAQGNPNLPNAGIADIGVQLSTTTLTTLLTGPSQALSNTPPVEGGYKVARLVALSNDPSLSNYIQLSKSVGGVSFPIFTPIAINLASTFGSFAYSFVDLLAAFNNSVPYNVAPGTILQVQLSVAPTSGKFIWVLADGLAAF
jgi:hypothetical protein